MWFITFLRSTRGRLLRVALGLSLIFYGSAHTSMWGLVLMMIGVVPAVTGIAGICLIEEVVKAVHASRANTRQPRGRHA